jgi:exodeoxyribonuclease V gamma subunit
MASHLTVSHSLNLLSDHLCEDLQHQPQDVFRPVYIITQTEGMNTWLKYRIAQKIGIAANYRYIKSQDLINYIYFLLGGRMTELLSEDNLPWILYKLLGENDFINKYPDISDYYTKELSEKEVKQMSLAEKTADLFDQYQIYRQEIIEEWNANDDVDNSKNWQEYLWKKSRILLEKKLPDKTTISRYIIEQLNDTAQQQRLKERLPVIYLFGLSITTNYHLRVYHAIAQYTAFKVLMINPSPTQFWFEDMSQKQMAILKRKGIGNIPVAVVGNPLLTNWGKVLQDTYNLFFRDENMLNAYNDLNGTPPEKNSLLQKIQNDIYENRTAASIFSEQDCTDGSIIINSSFSPAREVEVLYNYLVELIDVHKKQLSPRDIVVMVSDINLYAPYIKAVFDNAPYSFSYGIADENFVSGDTISSALQSLLMFTEEGFTSENVLQLLDAAPIRKRFGITNTQLIRKAVDKANIRFGIENELDNESIYVSWKYGLKRIMMGICMSGEDEYGVGSYSFYPLDMAEGSEAEELVRFNHFVEMLIEMIKEKEGKRTVTAWVEYVQSVLDNLIVEPENGTDEEYLSIINNLRTYNLLNDYFSDEVHYTVFAHHFLKNLHSNISRGSFITSGITFCSLIPMRSIPFKVVALLGMGFDKFPRKETTLSFSLIEQNKRKGDRNIKGNDKHLFLETLLSAQENFYISYVGQSTKDNTSIPPSLLVDELIEYIQSGAQGIDDVRKLIVKKHPLHGFSSKYNRNDMRLINYRTNESTGMRFIDTDKTAETFLFNEISLEALIGFFKNPFKGYYNNVLKIFYNEEDVLLSESEVFELDGLLNWNLKKKILTDDPANFGKLRLELVKKGQLPLKNMGYVTLKEVQNDIQSTKTIFDDLTQKEKPSSLPVHLELSDTIIKGSIENIYNDKFVFVSFSKKEIKYLMEAYIRFLVLSASGQNITTHFISQSKKNVYSAVALQENEAKKRLEDLVELYKSGHQQILLFYPDFNLSPNDLDTLDEKGFDKAVKDVVDNYTYPCNDRCIMNEYRGGLFDQSDVLMRYKIAAELLLRPLETVFPEYFLKPRK